MCHSQDLRSICFRLLRLLRTRSTANTFYREHVLQRTHSIENTFYREHILIDLCHSQDLRSICCRLMRAPSCAGSERNLLLGSIIFCSVPATCPISGGTCNTCVCVCLCVCACVCVCVCVCVHMREHRNLLKLALFKGEDTEVGELETVFRKLLGLLSCDVVDACTPRRDRLIGALTDRQAGRQTGTRWPDWQTNTQHRDTHTHEHARARAHSHPRAAHLCSRDGPWDKLTTRQPHTWTHGHQPTRTCFTGCIQPLFTRVVAHDGLLDLIDGLALLSRRCVLDAPLSRQSTHGRSATR